MLFCSINILLKTSIKQNMKLSHKEDKAPTDTQKLNGKDIVP